MHFTHDNPADALKAAGELLAAQAPACLVSVNLVPTYLCPNECTAADGSRHGIRLDLTVIVA
ncbi:hypothetical protein ABZ502_17170 [Streptomyces abikoensis]|uniref:hypothetical protein n=1 Tax=Streptomyces abikoensis TaxID=97398 RepID=UPI003401F0C0